MNSKIASCRTLLKSNWREKPSKIATHRRSPFQCRRYSQTTATNSQHLSLSGQNAQAIVAPRSLQFRCLPQCVVRVRDLTSLDVVLSSMVVDNDYQRNCDDLKTTRDGLARPDTSKNWGLRSPTKSKRNHNELFCRHKIFNVLKICRRTRRKVSALCSRYRIRQPQLTATHDDWR